MTKILYPTVSLLINLTDTPDLEFLGNYNDMPVLLERIWAYGVVFSRFDCQGGDPRSNSGRDGEISYCVWRVVLCGVCARAGVCASML